MISNLVEACSYVLSGQQSRFRATHVAIIQYDAKVFVKGVVKTSGGPTILHHI